MTEYFSAGSKYLSKFHFEDKTAAFADELDEELSTLNDDVSADAGLIITTNPPDSKNPPDSTLVGPVDASTTRYETKDCIYNEMMWTSVGSAEEALGVPKRPGVEIPLSLLAEIHGPITCVERRNFGRVVGDIFECTHYSVRGDARPHRVIGALRIGSQGVYADACQLTYFTLTASGSE